MNTRAFIAALVLSSAAAGALDPGPGDRAAGASPGAVGPQELAFRTAADNGARADEVFRRTRRMLHAWLEYADPWPTSCAIT